MVSGVLSVVSADLDVSTAAAGQLATVFALSYAVGAPLLAVLTGRWERRRLLVAALALAALGNGLTACAGSYELLLVSRVVSALGAALYTPAATLFATSLLPPEARARAVSWVFAGLSAALAVGVPGGALLADTIGYQGVFGVVAAMCAILALMLATRLPSMAAPPAATLRARLAVAADRRARIVLSVTVLGVVSAMSIYTYLAPLLEHTAAVDDTTLTVLLACYGAGAVLGNSLAGFAADRYGSLPALLVAVAGFLLVMASFPLTMTSVPVAAVTLLVWSAFTWSFNPPMQRLLLDISPAAAGGLLLSLNASAIYLGLGISGLAGGLVISLAGIPALPLLALAPGVIALSLLLILRHIGPHTPSASLPPVHVTNTMWNPPPGARRPTRRQP